MSGENELEECVDRLLCPLRVLLRTETPARVCYAITKEIESLDQKRLLTSCVNSLAARVNVPSADIWRSFNSLIQLRNYVHDNELAESNLRDILSRNSFDDDFIKVIINFINTAQPYKPAILNAVSKYPSFRSLRGRFQITIGRMTLLHAPDAMLQFWLRVGSGGWTTGIAAETSASVEEEMVFLVDRWMLNRFIEQIEKIMSMACKLERLHLK